jgi:hypothetical protein
MDRRSKVLVDLNAPKLKVIKLYRVVRDGSWVSSTYFEEA